MPDGIGGLAVGRRRGAGANPPVCVWVRTSRARDSKISRCTCPFSLHLRSVRLMK